MTEHPLKLLLAFLLEIAMLIFLGYWGFQTHTGILAWLLGLGLPIGAAVLWGVFRVDNAPGKAPVAVPGVVRLLLELVLLIGAGVLFWAAGQPTGALIYLVLVAISYLTMRNRVRWLIANRDGHAPLP